MKKTLCVSILSLYFSVNLSYSQLPLIQFGTVEKIAEGFQFVEGPVWDEKLGLLFSDIPANTVYCWNPEKGISEYLKPSENSNGLTLVNNQLVLAQHGSRQLGRLEKNGTITTLAAKYEGKRLNSPNDVAVISNGSVYFTDPPYGISSNQEELGFCGIYIFNASGRLHLLDKSLSHPNGIALSPDEKTLYVSDSEKRIIYMWNIINDSTISNKKQFAFMDLPGNTDGMKTDSYGHLFSTGPGGIWIFTPNGNLLKKIKIQGQTTNCCWGDHDRQTLYITSGNAVYRIRIEYLN